MSDAHFLDVKIMGREYRVACAPDEQKALIAAVSYVDEKMRDIAHRTRNTLPERIAVMVALNIAHDYLAQPKFLDTSTEIPVDTSFDSGGVRRRIADMGERLDAVLAQGQLDL